MKQTKLGSIAEIIMGQSPDGSSYNKNGKGVPLINGPTEFTNRYPMKLQWTIKPTKFCKKDDILLCVRGSSTGRINISDNKYCIGRGIAAIRTKNSNTTNLFLEQLLIFNTHKLLRLTAGSTFANIDKRTLNNIEIIVPSLAVQNKIASILSTWDKAIEKTATLIDSKAKLKKALMQQLLTGKLWFKEFVKSNKRAKTHYGEIPSDWKYPRIEEIADEVSDRNINGRDIPVLSCTKYDGLVDSLRYFGKRIFSKDTSNYKIVRRDQFAYATNHIEEGSIGLLNLLDEGLVSPMYTVFKTKATVYAPFLYKVFKTELYRHIFEVNTSGSIDRRGSLRWKHFRQIHIPLPSIEEQKKISACIDTCDRGIKLLQQLADALKTQKKGLMQKLLTGKIRVKV